AWNATIVHILHSVAEVVLGSYHPVDTRTQQDMLVDAVANSTNPSAAVRLFKRSHRSMRTSSIRIRSRSEAMTPVADAAVFYAATYKDIQQMTLTPPVLTSPDDSLVEGFSHAALTEYLKRYPLSKSAGPDGISPSMVKPLVDSTAFVSHLLLLFQFCVRCGQTPP